MNYGYTVVRKSDNIIMDDSIDSNDKRQLVLYPIFKKKSDCITYAQNTYNHDMMFSKLRWYRDFQVVKVQINLIN